jgi:hypothetical protein
VLPHARGVRTIRSRGRVLQSGIRQSARLGGAAGHDGLSSARVPHWRISGFAQPGDAGGRTRDSVAIAGPEHSNVSVANEVAGSLTGSNDHRYRATSGHIQPLREQLGGTSGHIWHRQVILRKCLLSSRSRVRVAVVAQMTLVNRHIRNYSRSNDLLLAGNHSYLTYRPADARQIALTRQNDGPGSVPQGWAAIGSQTGSQRHAMKPVHHGRLWRPAAPLGRPQDRTGGAWPAAGGARRRCCLSTCWAKVPGAPVGRASRILARYASCP